MAENGSGSGRNGTSGKLLVAAFATMMTVNIAVITAMHASLASRIDAVEKHVDSNARARMATVEANHAALEKAVLLQFDLSRSRNDRQDEAHTRQAVYNKEDQQRLNAIEREVWSKGGG